MKSLQLQVALLPSLLGCVPAKETGSVVIDTLRFTTTAANALAANCQSIHIAGSIEQAQTLARECQNPRPALLCGERNCRPIEGFDLGNSPLEYIPERISNRTLIFTTTNGTLAVKAASRFQHCLLGSLVNRSAVARQILELGTRHWQLICAGTDGEVAGEDVLAAGAIIAKLVELTDGDVVYGNDSARLASQLWSRTSPQSEDLMRSLISFAGGRHLVEAGYADDIAFASQLDLLNVVPKRTIDESCFAI